MHPSAKCVPTAGTRPKASFSRVRRCSTTTHILSMFFALIRLGCLITMLFRDTGENYQYAVCCVAPTTIHKQTNALDVDKCVCVLSLSFHLRERTHTLVQVGGLRGKHQTRACRKKQLDEEGAHLIATRCSRLIAWKLPRRRPPLHYTASYTAADDT